MNRKTGRVQWRTGQFYYHHTLLLLQGVFQHTNLCLEWHGATSVLSVGRHLAVCTSSSCTTKATRGSVRFGARCAAKTSSVRPTSASTTVHTQVRSRTVVDNAERGSPSKAAWGSTSAHTAGSDRIAAHCVEKLSSWCTIWSGTGSFTHTVERVPTCSV